MSLIINKINKGNKGGVFLRFIRVVFLLIIIFGPIAAASLFDLSACERTSRWYWIAAFCVLFFISFEIMESKHDKKGKYILTFSFLMGFVWQLLLFIPFILVNHPDATQAWNCSRSIAFAACLTVVFFLIEFLENKLFSKR
ncbi:MAG: hypothetical protein J5577_07915 [Bacteroidales bacterium]|nr:hypothetical protein [Bacteroidales bacterium]